VVPPFSELQAHAIATGQVPAALDLLSDEVRALLARRYAADVRLVAEHS